MKHYLAPQNLNKSRTRLAMEALEKAKYIKRTGTPGNYKYEYADDKKGRGSKANSETAAYEAIDTIAKRIADAPDTRSGLEDAYGDFGDPSSKIGSLFERTLRTRGEDPRMAYMLLAAMEEDNKPNTLIAATLRGIIRGTDPHIKAYNQAYAATNAGRKAADRLSESIKNNPTQPNVSKIQDVLNTYSVAIGMYKKIGLKEQAERTAELALDYVQGAIRPGFREADLALREKMGDALRKFAATHNVPLYGSDD